MSEDRDAELQLPTGWHPSHFGGVDLAYEHALAREGDLESTFSTQVNAAGFSAATSGALVGLLAGQDATGLYAAAALMALFSLGVALAVRWPGKWRGKGEPAPDWETADAVQLKRALVRESIARSRLNADRLRQTASLLKLSFGLLTIAVLLSTLQLGIHAVYATT